MGDLIKVMVKGIIFIIVLRIFAAVFFGLTRSFLGILGFGLAMLVPFIAILGIMLGIIYMVSKLSKTGVQNRSNTDRRAARRTSKILSYMSEEELHETEKALKEFFKTSDKLVIKGDVYLKPKNSNFKNIDELVLYKGDEAISTILGLSADHADKCREITDFLTGRTPVKSKINKFEIETETRAEKFREQIQAINDKITDEQISAGLDETVARLAYVRELEKSEPYSEKLRKLYDYYLPIMMSVLTKFKNIKGNPKSKAYKETKGQLVQTVDMINEALDNISKGHFDEEMTDINVDAKTLQSILKKDGVVGGGLVMPEFDNYENELEKALDKQEEKNDLKDRKAGTSSDNIMNMMETEEEEDFEEVNREEVQNG